MSKGAEQLLGIVRQIYPNQRVVQEYHIGGRLRLDIFLPSLSIAFEFNGVQHEVFTPHFHGDLQGFAEAKKRDLYKAQKCEELGIMLVIIKHSDELTVENVRNKIIGVIDET